MMSDSERQKELEDMDIEFGLADYEQDIEVVRFAEKNPGRQNNY